MAFCGSGREAVRQLGGTLHTYKYMYYDFVYFVGSSFSYSDTNFMHCALQLHYAFPLGHWFNDSEVVTGR